MLSGAEHLEAVGDERDRLKEELLEVWIEHATAMQAVAHLEAKAASYRETVKRMAARAAKAEAERDRLRKMVEDLASVRCFCTGQVTCWPCVAREALKESTP